MRVRLSRQCSTIYNILRRGRMQQGGHTATDEKPDQIQLVSITCGFCDLVKVLFGSLP